MSQHIIWRRLLPHLVSNCGFGLPGARLLTTSSSTDLAKFKYWKNHNNLLHGRRHWSTHTPLSQIVATSPQRATQLANDTDSCPTCGDECVILDPEDVVYLQQFISSRNGEILHYNKTGICQNQHQSNPNQNPSDDKKNLVENEKPSLEKLQQIEKTLIDSLSNLFVRPMDYKVYHSDLLFIDNIRGKRTTTLFQYVQQAALLRAAGHVKFAFVKLIILNTDISKEEGRITIRWRIVGIGAIQVMLQFWKFKLWDWKGIMERQGTWHDGVSYFDVDSNGLIYRHIADKMMMDKDKDVIEKPPKTVLAAGLLAALLFPAGSSLLQCSSSSSSSKYSSESITLP